MSLVIEYVCITCGKVPAENSKSMVCECGGPIRGQGPGISGTRDGFGVKNGFHDDQTGKTVDTWRKWEKAGFRRPKDLSMKGDMKEKITSNMKKRKHLGK